MNGNLHVFAGPTISADRVHVLAPAAIVHPPVQHGDLMRLDPAPGDTVLLIDGLWHQVPPVRHKEILELLHRGVVVVGAASMGALRAAELAPYGMIGVGWVYDQYATGRIDADDEVALIHTPEGQALSTALVCLRYALSAAADASVISAADADQLLALARELPYQRRSWHALGRAAACAGLADSCRRVFAWLNEDAAPGVGDIKATDAEDAVRQAAAGRLTPAATDRGWRDEAWRTSYLRIWVATYKPVADVNGVQVPLLPALQHAQLYDPGFPARWRTHVLAWIAGIEGTAATTIPAVDLEDRAISAAAARGLRFAALTPAQVEHWATPAEIIELCQRELLLRVLVRTARLDPTASVWPETPAEAEKLLDLSVSARAAAVAFRTNLAVAATGAGRTIEHLDPERVRAHLARQWELSAAPVSTLEMTAAARDRGILSTDAAVNQARHFYLAERQPLPADQGLAAAAVTVAGSAVSLAGRGA